MDIISGLSDELLIKILLLVPTKVAVSTSILSKRWEYLWMWLPKLEYGRHRRCSQSECKKLRCFLDRNLPLHKAPVLETFRLRVGCSCFKPENVHMWVSTAVFHCLRELEIVDEFCATEPNTLPSNLFTCKSLVLLKLDGEILLDVPRMVDLPSLKTLKLLGVTFLKDGTLQRLISSCLILEDLVVELREDDTTHKLTVVVPSLQSLSLFLPSDHDIEEYVIETPDLKYLKLRDYSRNDHYCLVEHMPNLIEAHLYVELPDIKSLIESITSVKLLKICSEAVLDGLAVFNQLEHLEVCTCMEHSSNQIIRLLKASSKLKRLDISLLDSHDPHQDMEDWNEPSTVPECILSSLQSLSWSSYSGKPQERDVVVYILKHALHLKTATIKSSGSAVQKLEMIKELSRSPRASTTCQLLFE